MAAQLLAAVAAAAGPIRAAYFYGDMPASHIQALGAAGFDRALVKFSADSLDAESTGRLFSMGATSTRSGVTLVPSFNLQNRSRLAALGGSRRYTWGARLKVESDVACPLDSAYWRSALLDRAQEFLAVVPEAHSLLLDLEIYSGALHHYDRGPCRCSQCLLEYAGSAGGAGLSSRDLAGLHSWEEVRLTRILTPMLKEFATRHPGVALGVFDLDLDSFVHRALARALARSGVPAADYCEKTYESGSEPLAGARGRLAALGLAKAPLIGGLWLQKWTPDRLAAAIDELTRSGDGYFIFTSFSLWSDPARLSGPYTLPASQEEYWSALRNVNRTR